MYQNYTVDHIKQLKTNLALGLPFSVSTPGSVNEVLALSGAKDGIGRAAQFIYDSNLPNALLSVEMRLTAFDPNLRYYPFVKTYAATTPSSSSTLEGIYVILNTLGSATDYSVDARVIVPRLQLAPNENQYVVVGYASNTTGSGFSEIVASARLHLDDVMVSQPSK